MSIAVLINSCDKYAWVWPAYKEIFERYWPDCPYPIYFITNDLEAPFGKTIHTSYLTWSDCLIEALPQIKEDTIIWTLEDIWFTKKVDTKALEQLCYNITRYPLDHIRLYVSEGSRKIPRKEINYELDRLNWNEDYRCSLNAGIWRKQAFQEVLEPGHNIWDSEHIMTEKSRNMDFATVKEMKYIEYDIDNNMVEQNKLTEHGVRYLYEEKIIL